MIENQSHSMTILIKSNPPNFNLFNVKIMHSFTYLTNKLSYKILKNMETAKTMLRELHFQNKVDYLTVSSLKIFLK